MTMAVSLKPFFYNGDDDSQVLAYSKNEPDVYYGTRSKLKRQ